jgi:hypothetical protein
MINGNPETSFNGMVPEHAPRQRRRRNPAPKRRNHAQAIRREERRRGRPLTADEQQSVIDMNTMRNRLFDFGLEYVGSDEDYYERRMREREQAGAWS